MQKFGAFRNLAAGVMGLCLAALPEAASAYNTVSFNSLNLNSDGQCNAAVNSSFNVFFNGDPTVDDFGGEDYFAVYLVDGTGTIIGRQNGSFGVAAGVSVLGAVSRTTITPGAGAFTVYFVDETTTGYSANVGDAYALTALSSHSFDPNVYDADCVGGAVGAGGGGGGGGGAGGGAGGGGGGGAGSAVVSNQVTTTQNTLVQGNLQRQANRLTSGGAGGAGGSGGSGGGDAVSTGGITTNTIDEEDDYQERAREIAKELAKELGTHFDGDAALSAYFSDSVGAGANAPFPLLQGSRRSSFSDREALKALASRVEFSTVGLSEQAQIAAFDGDIGPVLPETGVDVATSLPERREVNFFLFGSYANLTNSRNVGGDDRRFSGDAIAVTAGVDRRIAEGLTLGVSLSAITTELETYFNTGDYEDLTFAGGPYLVYQPSERLVVTASAGYAFSDIEQSRNNKTVTGETEAHAAFANVEIEFRPPEDDQLRLKSGLKISGAYKYTAGFTESDSTAVSGRRDVSFALEPKLEIAWREPLGASMQVEPFASFSGIWDLGDAINQDNEALSLGGGLRLLDQEAGWTGEVGAKTELGRDDYEAHTFFGSLSYGFSPSGDDALSASMNLSGDEDSAGLNVALSYVPGDILPDSKVSLSLDNDFDRFEQEQGPRLQISFSASF